MFFANVCCVSCASLVFLCWEKAGAEKHRTPDGRLVEIRNVWAHNLETEMVIIRDLVEEYPYVAMVREADSLTAMETLRGFLASSSSSLCFRLLQ